MLAGTSFSMFPAVLLYITAIAAVYAPSAFNETGSNDLTGRSLLGSRLGGSGSLIGQELNTTPFGNDTSSDNSGLIARDTSNPPKQITNSKGKIVLGHLQDGTDEHLDLVFGDSGNRSPTFTIN
ncbi:hypothetical protein PHLCEN_2v10236 [Hermanssonia centrifuga]|uniref:Uncharacterized protein n=1 Tax=Hermanssonia centrifuga TaxID=98765 RepID=A0A2R6NNI2_9APHY|nr:hypothetical protein PHLCEN_2v10236 [Hermanssonia centrifuga]